ncbi:TPA: hypothetical protein ACH3X1_010819 [Trebouxia sp. C0004]
MSTAAADGSAHGRPVFDGKLTEDTTPNYHRSDEEIAATIKEDQFVLGSSTNVLHVTVGIARGWALGIIALFLGFGVTFWTSLIIAPMSMEGSAISDTEIWLPPHDCLSCASAASHSLQVAFLLEGRNGALGACGPVNGPISLEDSCLSSSSLGKASRRYKNLNPWNKAYHADRVHSHRGSHPHAVSPNFLPSTLCVSQVRPDQRLWCSWHQR